MTRNGHRKGTVVENLRHAKEFVCLGLIVHEEMGQKEILGGSVLQY
jgi:hypothetical protein